MPGPPLPERGQGSTDNRPLGRRSCSGVTRYLVRHFEAIVGAGSTHLFGVWNQILDPSPAPSAPALGPDHGRHLLEGLEREGRPHLLVAGLVSADTGDRPEILAKRRGCVQYTARSCPSIYSMAM